MPDRRVTVTGGVGGGAGVPVVDPGEHRRVLRPPVGGGEPGQVAEHRTADPTRDPGDIAHRFHRCHRLVGAQPVHRGEDDPVPHRGHVVLVLRGDDEQCPRVVGGPQIHVLIRPALA